jgi:ketol-acid reductoisomerase
MSRVAVIGYGNQGRAHVLNLRDSGVDVVVGSRVGKSFDQATLDGFTPVAIAAAAREETVMITLPDGPMAGIYAAEIEPHLPENATILFAHGFNIVFDAIKPRADLGVGLISPKAAGYGVRLAYTQKTPLAGLLAVHQDPHQKAWPAVWHYAKAIGISDDLALETTFRQETVTDLFGEQAVLCGGIPELIRAGFHTLVEAGYAPEIAYFECVHETKLIVDKIVAEGISGMRAAISDTAGYGGLTIGPVLIDDGAKQKMKFILERIESGEFAHEWLGEVAAGTPVFEEMKRQESEDAVESVGTPLRAKLNRLEV